jgi:SWI/SNF-related matrix-associated actin-dependent regulator of chromatin subfamily A protein 2/4
MDMSGGGQMPPSNYAPPHHQGVAQMGPPMNAGYNPQGAVAPPPQQYSYQQQYYGPPPGAYQYPHPQQQTSAPPPVGPEMYGHVQPMYQQQQQMPPTSAPAPVYSMQPHQAELQKTLKAIADMEAKGMQNDPRYSQLVQIANRLKGSSAPTHEYYQTYNNPQQQQQQQQQQQPQTVQSASHVQQHQQQMEAPYQPQGYSHSQQPSYQPAPSDQNNQSQTANVAESGNLNVNQINQLKAQVHAYRLLARNQPLPPNLTAIAFGQNAEKTG